MSNQVLRGNFTIPDELARELSELLTKETIRTRVLTQVADDPNKFEKLEESLIPITSKIEAIKYRITNEFVPEHFRFSQYVWNYDGYEVSGNSIQIYEMM